jgi:hypothetical protein
LPSEAVATALAIAAENGLRCEEPVVLRDAWHVLVHLRPLPLVARVSTTVPFPEGPHADDVVRELAVASHAARGGAPVIPPSDELDPGPHCRDGRFVTFWRYVERTGEVDALRAGEGLRAVHEALADYAGPLPAAGHRPDVTAMLATLEPSAYVELLGEIAATPRPSTARPCTATPTSGTVFRRRAARSGTTSSAHAAALASTTLRR